MPGNNQDTLDHAAQFQETPLFVASWPSGPTDFQVPDFGRATRRPGDRWAFWYFLPAPIPRELTLEPATVLALSEADAALGHLHGLGHLITDPQLPVGPYITREALASSRIEGTQASLAEVLQAEARGEDRLPGQLRRSPVWVGSPTDNPDTAIFVPPLPEHLAELLTDWENSSMSPAHSPSLPAAP